MSKFYDGAIFLIIQTRGTNTIDLGVRQDWPPGMYVVQVTSGEELANKKLVSRR